MREFYKRKYTPLSHYEKFKRGLGVNEAEDQFTEEMTENGWSVSKKGWPDFICRRGDELIFVEVKPHPNVDLRDQQKTVMQILADKGFLCFRWDPQLGFTDMQKNPVAFPFTHVSPREKETLSEFMQRIRDGRTKYGTEKKY